MCCAERTDEVELLKPSMRAVLESEQTGSSAYMTLCSHLVFRRFTTLFSWGHKV